MFLHVWPRISIFLEKLKEVLSRGDKLDVDRATNGEGLSKITLGICCQSRIVMHQVLKTKHHSTILEIVKKWNCGSQATSTKEMREKSKEAQICCFIGPAFFPSLCLHSLENTETWNNRELIMSRIESV